jgi:hypothetical protein
MIPSINIQQNRDGVPVISQQPSLTEESLALQTQDLILDSATNPQKKAWEKQQQENNKLVDSISILELNRLKLNNVGIENDLVDTHESISNQKQENSEFVDSNKAFSFFLSKQRKIDLIINPDLLSSEEDFVVDHFDQKMNKNSTPKNESLRSQAFTVADRYQSQFVFLKEVIGLENWNRANNINYMENSINTQDHSSVSNPYRTPRSILLQIDPSGLDTILVHVKLADKDIMASFIVQSNETRALLRSNLSALSEALLDIGISKQHISYHVNSHHTLLEQSTQFTSGNHPDAWSSHEDGSQSPESQGGNEEEISLMQKCQDNLIDIII